MRQFLYIVRLAMLDALEFRMDILLYSLSGLARPLIFLAIWLAALSSGAKTTFTKEEFIAYYLLVMVLGAWVSAWTAPFLSSKIRYGRLSPYLLRPFSYLLFDLGNNIGEKIFKLAYSLAIALALGIIFKVQPPVLTPLELGAIGISLITALFLNYLTDFCIGLVAFWTSEVRSLVDFLDLFIFIFSGLLFPLALLPSQIQNIAGYLPFRYIMSFPIEIYLHKLTSAEIIFGLAMELFWLMAIILLYKFMWRKGLKVYSAIGA